MATETSPIVRLAVNLLRHGITSDASFNTHSRGVRPDLGLVDSTLRPAVVLHKRRAERHRAHPAHGERPRALRPVLGEALSLPRDEDARPERRPLPDGEPTGWKG